MASVFQLHFCHHLETKSENQKSGIKLFRSVLNRIIHACSVTSIIWACLRSTINALHLSGCNRCTCQIMRILGKYWGSRLRQTSGPVFSLSTTWGSCTEVIYWSLTMLWNEYSIAFWLWCCNTVGIRPMVPRFLCWGEKLNEVAGVVEKKRRAWLSFSTLSQIGHAQEMISRVAYGGLITSD